MVRTHWTVILGARILIWDLVFIISFLFYFILFNFLFFFFSLVEGYLDVNTSATRDLRSRRLSFTPTKKNWEKGKEKREKKGEERKGQKSTSHKNPSSFFFPSFPGVFAVDVF